MTSFSQAGCKHFVAYNLDIGDGYVGGRYDGWTGFVDQVFLGWLHRLRMYRVGVFGGNEFSLNFT